MTQIDEEAAGARQLILDRLSQPMRDAVQKWMREHGFGGASGWLDAEECWRFELWTREPKKTINVRVDEDGKSARAWVVDAEFSVATTPSGLRRVLDRLLREG